VNPQSLEALGFDDYLKDIPTAVRQNFRLRADVPW